MTSWTECYICGNKPVYVFKLTDDCWAHIAEKWGRKPDVMLGVCWTHLAFMRTRSWYKEVSNKEVIAYEIMEL